MLAHLPTLNVGRLNTDNYTRRLMLGRTACQKSLAILHESSTPRLSPKPAIIVAGSSSMRHIICESYRFVSTPHLLISTIGPSSVCTLLPLTPPVVRPFSTHPFAPQNAALMLSKQYTTCVKMSKPTACSQSWAGPLPFPSGSRHACSWYIPLQLIITSTP